MAPPTQQSDAVKSRQYAPFCGLALSPGLPRWYCHSFPRVAEVVFEEDLAKSECPAHTMERLSTSMTDLEGAIEPT